MCAICGSFTWIAQAAIEQDLSDKKKWVLEKAHIKASLSQDQ